MKAKTSLCAYSANLKAIIALIFFCFLFFYQEKKRKSGHGGEAPVKAPTNLLHLPDAPHEGRNNPLHLSGQLDGDHRLDLLLLPFLPSREEKEVGARGRSPRESPNEPPTPIQTNPMKVQTTSCTYLAELRAIITLISFCFLFFYQEKKRKSGHGGEAPAKGPTNLLRLPYAPYEGRNNPRRPFGRTR